MARCTLTKRCYYLYLTKTLQLVFIPLGTLGHTAKMLRSCRLQHETNVLQIMIAIESPAIKSEKDHWISLTS